MTAPWHDPERSLAALAPLLLRLGRLCDLPEEKITQEAPSVSDWSLAQHAFHSVLACDLSFHNVTALTRERGRLIREPVEKHAEAGEVLRKGLIQRGRAQAPRFVQPPARLDLDLLRQLHGEVSAARDKLAADLEGVRGAPKAIPHQLLGDLSAAEWLRFARIHTAHHLLIARDIRRETGLDPAGDEESAPGGQE